MRSLFLFLVILVAGVTCQAQSKGTATAAKVAGYYVFVNSEPVAEYSKVGEFSTVDGSGALSMLAGQQRKLIEIIEASVKAAEKLQSKGKLAAFDAIILINEEKAMAIKWTE